MLLTIYLARLSVQSTISTGMQRINPKIFFHPPFHHPVSIDGNYNYQMKLNLQILTNVWSPMEDAAIIATTFQEHFTVDVLRGQQWLETIWHVMVSKGCASIVNSE